MWIPWNYVPNFVYVHMCILLFWSRAELTNFTCPLQCCKSMRLGYPLSLENNSWNRYDTSEVRKAWVEEAKSAYIGNPLYCSCFNSDHCLLNFQGEGSGTPAIEWLTVPHTASYPPHSLWFTQGRWFVELTRMDQRLYSLPTSELPGVGALVLAKCWGRRRAPHSGHSVEIIPC